MPGVRPLFAVRANGYHRTFFQGHRHAREAPKIQYREVVRPPATQVDAVRGTPTGFWSMRWAGRRA
ncbi:MAG: hypothetical protein IPI73_13070 [Betaproteobacteria bacterium]|nr:hypothetical protein [Betaproteobacteria bacterium]